MRRIVFAVIAGFLLGPALGCSENKPAENNSKDAPLPSGPGAGPKGQPAGPPKPPPPLPGKNS